MGQLLVFRWVDLNVTSSDDGLALDDVVFSTGSGSAAPSVTTQPTNQSVTAGGVASFTAAASGSPTPGVIWQVKVPGGSFTDLINGGVYSGVDTNTLTVTGSNVSLSGNLYRAVYTNGSGSATTDEVSLTVNSATIMVSPATLPDPVLSTAYSQSVTASGGSNTFAFNVSAGALPDGLTLSGAGALTGTPTLSGTYTFTVQATDAFGSTGTRPYTLVVPLVLSPASLPDGTLGVVYSQAVTVAGGVAPYLFSVSAGALPDGLTLDTNSGTITGTPSVANTFNFTITATNGAGRSGSRSYSVVVAPSASVSSIVRTAGPDTNAAAVSWTVTFNQAVSGLADTNFTLTDLSNSLTGEGITSVVPVGGAPATQWTVTASTGTGDGTLRLNATDAAGVTPTLINLPTNVTTADYAVDKTAPTVVIGAPSVSLTAGGPVSFTVTYTGADNITLAPGDVTLSPTGGVSATVGVSGSGNTRTVTLTGITGNGSIGISLVAGTASDNATNSAAAAGPSATVQVDNTPPTVVSVDRFGAASVTNAGTVQYTVTFSEAVSLGATPFTTTTTGTLSGVSVESVAGGPTVYTVTVNTGSGDGTVRLDVPAGSTVRDPAGNAVAPFAVGEVFTIDRTAPAVTIGAPSATLTAGGPVSFLVTYTDTNLIPFTLLAAQVQLNRTGSANATVSVSGSGNTRAVTLTGITGDGTLSISLPPGTAADAAGNQATAAGPSTAVTVDNTAPTVMAVTRVGSALTNAATVRYSVTFSEAVSGVSPAGFTPVGASLTGLSVVSPVTGGPSNYLVDVNTGSGDGALGLDVPANLSITDAAGNALATTFTSGESFTLDRTAPTVSIGAPSVTLTRGGPVSFTITYSDANGVTPSLVPGQVTLDPTGGATATIEVTGSGNTRTVTLTSITGNGTLGISIAPNTAADGATNPAPSAGPSATFTVDNTAPSVTSVVRAAANPTNAASAPFTVTFDEDVGTPALGAFSLSSTGTLSGASVTSVTPVNARTYTVAVATGSGDGTIRLDISSAGGITDTAGNPLAVGFTTGEAFTVLKTAPAVATISPANGSVVGPIGYGGSVSGTAADALGGTVPSVSVTIRRSSDSMFWTGSAWASSGSLAAAVSGTAWSVPFPPAAQDTGLTYTISSTATDAAGNDRTAVAVAYQWDAAPAAATVALAGSVFGPGNWSGNVGGDATDTGPAGVAVVHVVVTRSADGFSYDSTTQTWAAGAFTNAVTPAGGAWSLLVPTTQLAHDVSYTVTAAAVDAVGNEQGSPASGTFSFDDVAPISAVTTPVAAFVGPAAWPASSQIAGIVSDSGSSSVAGVAVRIVRSSDGFFWDGSTWQAAPTSVAATVSAGSWSYTLPTAALTDGVTYTVTSTATDGAGNVQAAPGSRSFTWDAAIPSQTITTPTAGSFVNPVGFTGFTGTTADPGAAASGVATVSLTLTRTSDGLVWNGVAFVSGSASVLASIAGGNWSYSFNPADLADGVTYTLDATARDVAGNVGTSDVTSFTLDATGPTVTISVPAAGSTVTASGWGGLAGSAADGGAGVQLVEFRVLTAGGLVWNGGAFAATGSWFAATGTTTWSDAFAFTNFPAAGGYRVEARGRDTVGNIGPVTSVDFTVNVPEVTTIARLTPSVAVSNTTAPVTWRVNFSDPVSGVTAANFALVGSFAAGAAITNATPVGGAAPAVAWDVTASTPAAGTGDLGLNYVSNVNLTPVVASATVVGAVYTLDRLAPTVAVSNDAPGAVIRVNQAVRYTVTFADDTGIGVLGLTPGDVTNAVTAGAAPFGVSGFTFDSVATYTFDVTLTGEGDFRLRLAAPVVIDVAGNPLSVPVTDTTLLAADGTAPTVLSVVPVGSSPTAAATVAYTVTFSEPVTGVGGADFFVTTTGSIVPGAVSVSGSGSTYTVTLGTGTGDGTLRLDVLNDGTILDAAENPLATGFTTAAAITIDRTAPTASIALAAGQPTPTHEQPVRYVVTFSEPVSGFEAADVALVGTAGGIATATTSVTNPSGDDRTYLVAVSGLTADGTVGFIVPAGAAADAAGNLSAVAVSSPTVTLDLTAPFVTGITRLGSTPTNASSVGYAVIFSEAVSGVDLGDFAIVTTGLSGASITSVGGGGTSWTVLVSTGSGSGTLRLDLRPAATVTDTAGNSLVTGGFTGEVYDLDRTPPAATIVAPTPALRNTPVGGITVTFDQAVTGLDATDFALTRDGLPINLSVAQLSGGGSVYALGNLAGLTGVGGVYVLTLTATGSGVTDAAGNALAADAGTTFTVDVAAPTVTITPVVAGPTNAGTVAFTVGFSEAVLGVDTDAAGGFVFFAVTGTAPGASILSIVPGTAGLFTVTVATGVGEGTVGLVLGANTVISDGAGNAVGGLPAASGFTTVDHVRPTVSITDGDADGVVALNVGVTFTVDVLDAGGVLGTLTASDFENAGSAGATVGAVTENTISGGKRFTLAVTPTSGGTLQLRLRAGAAATDAAGNAPVLPATGRVLAVDAAAPTVTVARAAGQAAVTNSQSVRFAVAFSEQVVGFGPGGVQLGGPGAAGATVGVSGDGQTFVVTVSGLSADGLVTLTVPAGVVTDVAGNLNTGSTGGDNAVTLDTVPPAVGSPALDPASDTGAADGVTADATPTFTGSAEAGATVELFEGSTRLGTATATAAGWTITSSLLGDGPHTVFARATDAAGNVSDSAPVTVTVDTTRPAVSVTRGPSQAATVLGTAGGVSVTFTVTITQAVGPLDPAAVSVVGTAGGTVTGVSGSGTTFLVTVGGITRPGGVSVAVAAGAAADAAGNPTLASPAGEVVAVQYATTTVVTVPGEPVRAGELLPIGVLVSHTAGVPVSGTVTVTLSGPGGSFTQTVPALGAAVAFTGVPAGGYAVTAAFAGTGGFLDSTGTAGVTVLPALPKGQNSTGVYAAVTGSTVTLFEADGSVRGTVQPFTRDESPFGVRVAVADVTGDGVPDVIAGTAPGVPAAVRVLDGVTGATLFSRDVFEGFTGGVYVAAGDMNGDGKSEIVVTPDQGGGARVLVFDGATGTQLASFFGIQDPNFRGGARVAVGDLNADGVADLLVSAGFGGGPRVAGYDGASVAAGQEPKKLFNDFFLFAPDLRDGVFVTVGDVDGDGYGDVIGGAGPGGAPRVLTLSGFDLVTSNTLTPVANFFAGPTTLRGGVQVTAKDFDGDGRTDLVTGSGDTGAVFVYGNAALNAADPQADGGLDMLPGLLPGVRVG
ncbi:Ig-like domain-containing protein [Urbifossiella limnaea]|uniref:Ig-like domain-containing protein n=1 Tax=Urbifossiella limnaea TaxID=2528023 RepID=UPI00192E372A|nr:Ig-like domain-containing protein [Urbifossiella limnaea]